jgi:hypothetical protein
VEIAAGAAAIAGLKIVAAAHSLSFTEAALKARLDGSKGNLQMKDL